MSSDSDIADTSSEDEQQQANDEQQVTGANADPQVLQYFWDLASLEQEERQAAATSLVKALVHSQQQHDLSHRTDDVQLGGSLDQEGGNRQQRMGSCLSCCSPLMAYGLKRLARGLASSRQGARQGFAAALAATLAHSAAAADALKSSNKRAAEAAEAPLQQPFVSAAGVLALLEACLEVTGSMKGSEQRDALLGRVFGLAALVRSGLATALPEAPAGGATAERGVAVVAEQLVGLLQRKAFLRESAAAALVELLSHLDSLQMQQVAAHAPRLVAMFQVPVVSATPESLFIALRLWHNMPAQQLHNCQLLPALPSGAAPPPALLWQQPGSVQRSSVAAAAAAVFAAGHLKGLCPALLATTASHPRLHPVWGCLLALLVPGFVPVKVLQPDADQDQPQQQSRTAPDPRQLASFWQHFVEDSCLNSSHERKALAVQLLQLLLPVLTPESVPVLLSKPMLGCLNTAIRNKDSYLHTSACRCLDRIKSCAEHSLIAKSDPSLSAKLRLALTAQLGSANLQQAAAAGSGKAKGQQGLLQGLDAAGVAAFVDQLLEEFVAAARQAGGAANGNAAAGGDQSEDEDMGDADVDDTRARQLLDQLAAALRIPAADDTTLHKGLTFLTAAAFLNLPAGLKAAALAGVDAAAAAAPTPAGKPSKKHKGSKGGAAAAAAASSDSTPRMEQQVLELAAQMQPPPPPQRIRQQCAAKLIMLLHSLQNRAAHYNKQQQRDNAKGDAAPSAAAAETKAQKKAQQQADQAAERHAAGQQQEALTAGLLKLVITAAHQLSDVQLTADEDVVEMVHQLQALEAAVAQHMQQQQQQQQSSKADGAPAPAAVTKSRVVLLLVRQLQLQLLSGALTAEAAGSVVDDLEAAVVKGLGISGKGLGMDAAAVAAAAAAAAAVSDGSSSDDEQGSDSENGSEDGEPAWQDVLLDLLLALLSNSSSADAAKGGGVLIPTAPLREACEAVFRAFAQDITAQGLSDMLRVLSQRASEVAKKDDEEDDEKVEMDIDGSDQEDDQLADVSDQSEQEDEQAAQEAADSEHAASEDEQAPTAAKKQASAAAAAAAGSEEGEDSGSDLDDDAMMRMEAQLGAAVRSLLSRGGGSAKERASALLGLQLRVAALLEEWLKKCSKSPLVLQIVSPLLKALVAARGAGGNPTLADRLASIVNKQLSKCRPALVLQARQQDSEAVQPQPGQYNITAFEADVRKVLYYASREKDPRVSAAAAQALLVLLHAGEESSDTSAAAAAVQATAAAALSDFFDKKKSRLQKQWCEQLLLRCPVAVLGGDAAAVQALLTACNKGRNESVRGQAAALLPVLTRTPQQELLLSALQRHKGLVAAALGAAVTGPYKNKELHAAAVKSVVGLLAGVGKMTPGKRLAEVLGSETIRELGKVVVVAKAAGVAPRVETQLDRLVEVAGLQQLVASGNADPARLALLKSSEQRWKGKAPAAGKGQQQPGSGAEGDQEEQQQKSDKKGKRQKLGGAEAVAAGDGKKPKKGKQPQQQQRSGEDAAAAAAAAGKRKKEKDEKQGRKKHKVDKQ